MDGEQISDGWRLCEQLTVKQAALLYAGCDPASTEGTFCEEWKPDLRPAGYEAAKQSISVALRKGKITGTHVELSDVDWNGNIQGSLPNTTDIGASDVDRNSLVQWLRLRGVTTGFFFPAVDGTPGFLDPEHPRYAPKLAAAVRAWEAVTDAKGKSPKQALEKWLREHAADFGLTDDDGNPVNLAIEECSKVANWSHGGAPKTPGKN